LACGVTVATKRLVARNIITSNKKWRLPIPRGLASAFQERSNQS